MSSIVNKLIAAASKLTPKERSELLAAISRIDVDDVVIEPIPDYNPLLTVLCERLPRRFLSMDTGEHHQF